MVQRTARLEELRLWVVLGVPRDKPGVLDGKLAELDVVAGKLPDAGAELALPLPERLLGVRSALGRLEAAGSPTPRRTWARRNSTPGIPPSSDRRLFVEKRALSLSNNGAISGTREKEPKNKI